MDNLYDQLVRGVRAERYRSWICFCSFTFALKLEKIILPPCLVRQDACKGECAFSALRDFIPDTSGVSETGREK